MSICQSRRNSTSLPYALITKPIFGCCLLLAHLRPDLSAPSSLTEYTSDDQYLGTFDDTLSVAKFTTLKSQPD